jgi:hypothetical protein
MILHNSSEENSGNTEFLETNEEYYSSDEEEDGEWTVNRQVFGREDDEDQFTEVSHEVNPELPVNLQGDDLRFALVRHKGVNLRYLDELAQEVAVENELSLFNDRHGVDDYNELAYSIGYYDVASIDEIELQNPKKGKKPKQIPNYRTKRQVVLIQNAKKLATFCEMLQKSVRQAAAANCHNTQASAVGFDVEYASLEQDIRGTLPAMLQLAGPTAQSQVGLIWLDKFPDHGRNMLKDEYEPLLNILTDSTILKVGVGASKDANNLAAWWGIDDTDDMKHFASGIIDIEHEDEKPCKNVRSCVEDATPKAKTQNQCKNQKEESQVDAPFTMESAKYHKPNEGVCRKRCGKQY